MIGVDSRVFVKLRAAGLGKWCDRLQNALDAVVEGRAIKGNGAIRVEAGMVGDGKIVITV